MDDDNWDLFAVVRGCSAAAAAASSSATTAATTVFSAAAAAASASSYRQNPIFSPVSIEPRHGYPNTNGVFGELRDLYSPFLQEPSASVSVSSFSCLNYNEEQKSHQRQPQNKRPLSASVSSSSVTSRPTTSNTSKSKRRKMQQKKVCHVPAEALNNDVWAWRKYGQKPIKGSPYPRGYYRCSTSKGCLARKQVERNRSDPTMFIVTYTAEHNHPAPTHRNSLAGSTRQKPSDQPPAVSAAAVTDCTKSPATTTTTTTTATSTSAAGAACSSSSPVTSADNFAFPMGNFDRDDDLLSLSDTVVSDDFFDGLEDFAVGDSFSGSSPACYDLSWIADNAAATAGDI